MLQPDWKTYPGFPTSDILQLFNTWRFNAIKGHCLKSQDGGRGRFTVDTGKKISKLVESLPENTTKSVHPTRDFSQHLARYQRKYLKDITSVTTFICSWPVVIS